MDGVNAEQSPDQVAAAKKKAVRAKLHIVSVSDRYYCSSWRCRKLYVAKATGKDGTEFPLSHHPVYSLAVRSVVLTNLN